MTATATYENTSVPEFIYKNRRIVAELFQIKEFDMLAFGNERDVRKLNLYKQALLWAVDKCQVCKKSQLANNNHQIPQEPSPAFNKILESSYVLLNTASTNNKIIAAKILKRFVENGYRTDLSIASYLTEMGSEKLQKFQDQMCAALTFRETPLLRLLVPLLVNLGMEDNREEACHKLVDHFVYELQFIEDQVSFIVRLTFNFSVPYIIIH